MKKSNFILLPALAISLFILTSCRGEKQSANHPAVIHTETSSDIWELSDEETQWLNAKTDNGGLRAVSVLYPGLFEFDPDGTPSGFHGNLLKSLREFLGIDIQIDVVGFDDLFSIDGVIPEEVKTDPDFVYRPDIFDSADILAFEITKLPWRLKLMDIIKFSIVRNLLVTRNENEIRQLGDLYGKSIMTYQNSSQSLLLENIRDDLQIDFHIVDFPFGKDRYGPLKSGEYDATIMESGQSLVVLKDHPELALSLPVGPVLTNGWAVSPENDILSSILGKFQIWVEHNDVLNNIWKDTYGIGIEQYEDLITVDELGTIDLTPEDEIVLNRIRRNGGLRASIADSDTSYEIDSQGRITGFQYNLLLAAAHELDIPLVINPVSFTEFFTVDGSVPRQAMSDPDFEYKPDLLMKSDVYVAAMSPLPWRSKFLKFIPLYPNKMVFVVSSGTGVLSTEEMKNSRFVVMEGTSWYDWIVNNFPETEGNLLYAVNDKDLINAVVDGSADITLYDANLILPRLKSFRSIDFYPADNKIDMLSWAVAADDDALGSLLGKTLEYLKTSGRFSQLWDNYYDVSLSDYLLLLKEG